MVPEAKLEKSEHGLVPKGEADGGVAHADIPSREPAGYRSGWLPE
jgi:hypothetical protein